MYRLFSWEHSYFSGKVRAYLRYKDRNAALGAGYEDILATPELIVGLLAPRSGRSPSMVVASTAWVLRTATSAWTGYASVSSAATAVKKAPRPATIAIRRLPTVVPLIV